MLDIIHTCGTSQLSQQHGRVLDYIYSTQKIMLSPFMFEMNHSSYSSSGYSKMSHCMRKPTICIGENKGADQLRGKPLFSLYG